MGIEFRCEHCGKVLSAEAESGGSVKCPHCGQMVTVPEGLASLPRPQVPTAPGQGAGGQGAPAQAQPPAEEEAADSARGESLIAAMSVVMPWVMSLFLHAGVFLILALITAIMTDAAVSAKPEGIIIPDAALSDKPGGSMSPYESTEQESVRKRITERQKRSQRDSAIADAGKTHDTVDLIGVGGTAGGGSDFTLAGPGSSAEPRSTFFGHGGNAYHVVYVIDCSGSMAASWYYVRDEMLRSISMLQSNQTFHIIFFSGADVVENSHRRLVPATKDYKRDAAEFLEGIRPGGTTAGLRTSPVAGLDSAFECLEHARKDRHGKIIYLLTDGLFTDSPKVLSAIRSWNKSKEVHINTYLYAHRHEEAVEVMKQIAAENGGTFKYVSADE